MIGVYFLPSLAASELFTGRTVVVIDVLRATTTLTWALAAGAREVFPFEDIELARRQGDALGTLGLTGGERGGRKIPGFDLGNSPAEFTSDRVGGKSICFTTTNGTRAMQACRHAGRILLGAFVNLTAVCRCLPDSGGWDLVCAGTDGQITREDVLLAGAILETYRQSRGEPARLPLANDQAAMAAELWSGLVSRHDPLGPPQLATILAASHGGRNLRDIGQGDDIGLAAELDRFSLVPELDPLTWRIIPAQAPADGN
jgi:2-phosphosulfolactate phosphatase